MQPLHSPAYRLRVAPSNLSHSRLDRLNRSQTEEMHGGAFLPEAQQLLLRSTVRWYEFCQTELAFRRPTRIETIDNWPGPKTVL